MKLNAYLSKTGYCSRRKAVDLVKNSKVSINNVIVNNPAYEVKASDIVSIDGKNIYIPENIYLLFNKPRGVICTLDDKFAEKKITDYIEPKFGRLYPVGRLDKDTTGLIILTNDGDLSYRVTHPKFLIEKEYIASIDKALDGKDEKKLLKGIYFEGSMMKFNRVKYLTRDKKTIAIILNEGKKREIRLLLYFLGYRVKRLNRIRIGGIRLGGIKEGRYTTISREKIYSLINKNG